MTASLLCLDKLLEWSREGGVLDSMEVAEGIQVVKYILNNLNDYDVIKLRLMRGWTLPQICCIKGHNSLFTFIISPPFTSLLSLYCHFP